jgi:hypothetical protein
MAERNNDGNSSRPDEMTRQEGMQGIDKAPGEEPASGTENPVYETQKGKNKVDGDPSKESDQPLSRS